MPHCIAQIALAPLTDMNNNNNNNKKKNAYYIYKKSQLYLHIMQGIQMKVALPVNSSMGMLSI